MKDPDKLILMNIINRNMANSWFLKASIESFIDSGRVSGTFYTAIEKIAKEYHQTIESKTAPE